MHRCRMPESTKLGLHFSLKRKCRIVFVFVRQRMEFPPIQSPQNRSKLLQLHLVKAIQINYLSIKKCSQKCLILQKASQQIDQKYS